MVRANVNKMPIYVQQNPIDVEEDFVEMPLVAGACTAATQIVGKGLAKLPAPLTHRLVQHDHTACCEQLFDISKAEIEAEIQPHRMCDDVVRKAKSFV